MKFLKVIAEYSLISIKQLSLLFKILITVSVGLFFVIIFAGASVDRIYYWGLLILLPLMFVSIRIYQKSTFQKLLSQLREDWGKEKEKDRNFSEIESFYRYSTTKSDDSDILIDDQT